jgi:hypothetical protein
MSKQRKTKISPVVLAASTFVAAFALVFTPVTGFAVEGGKESRESDSHDKVRAQQDEAKLATRETQVEITSRFAAQLGRKLSPLELTNLNKKVPTPRTNLNNLTVADALAQKMDLAKKSNHPNAAEMARRFGEATLAIISHEHTYAVDEDVQATNTVFEIAYKWATGEVSNAEAEKFMVLGEKIAEEVKANDKMPLGEALKKALTAMGFKDTEDIKLKLLRCKFELPV